MATVILIVFVAIVAVLGGWWLKRERENQKKELINKGKLAAGKLDEVVLPKKKPKKRQRKKRQGSFWDPKYVPPEKPSKAMLQGWMDQTAEIVDELLPRLAAYRAGKVEDEPAQKALKAAEAALTTSYPGEADTEVEAKTWYATSEASLQAFYDARTAAANSAGTLRKLFTPARESALRLKFLVSDADLWETYKAPEVFHEKLEIAQLLVADLTRELELDNANLGFNVGDSFNRRRRRHSSNYGSFLNLEGDDATGGDNTRQSGGFKLDDEKREDEPRSDGFRRGRSLRPWQNLDGKDGASDFGFGDRWEPKPPKDDTEITGRAHEALLEALPSIAALAHARAVASSFYKSYQKATSRHELTRPTKPSEQEAEGLLAIVLSWAQTAQSAHLQAHRDGKTLGRCLEEATEKLASLSKLISKLKDARIPPSDNFRKDVVTRAFEMLDVYVKNTTKYSSYMVDLAAPYSLNTAETQAHRDAANSVRNLMRKAAFAMGQAEVAKAAVETAKGEHVQQAEFVAPVLTQSSVSAFVNAHARMSEIKDRNRQKKDAHSTKVKELERQHNEREKQAAESIGAITVATKNWTSSPMPAGMQVMHQAATAFAAAFKK